MAISKIELKWYWIVTLEGASADVVPTLSKKTVSKFPASRGRPVWSLLGIRSMSVQNMAETAFTLAVGGVFTVPKKPGAPMLSLIHI